MDNKVIYNLVSNSIFNTNVAIDANINWSEIMEELSTQTILGIPFEFISTTAIIPAVIKQQWIAKSLRQQAIYQYLIEKQTELVDLLNNNGITVVILKGTAVGAYYPNPSYRSYGDIDFLVKNKDYERTYQILLNNGYVLEGEVDICDHHIEVIKDGLIFELHSKINGIDGKLFEQEIKELCELSLDSVQFLSCEGIKVPVMEPVMNGLTLIFHIVQHLRRGLGLRQMMDWMIFAYNEIDDIAWECEYRQLFKRFKVDKIAMIATKVAKMYLGMPSKGIKGKITWCDSIDDNLATALIEYVMEQGNFGTKRNDSEGKSIKGLSDYMGIRRFFRKFQSGGYYHWSFAQRHKWLKPFSWIYQIFRVFNMVRRRGFGNTRKDMKIAKARKMLFDEWGINE